MVVRQKAKVKCECGKTVSLGSVFCPHCRAEINRKNAETMKKEGRGFQKKMRQMRKGRKST